MNIAAEFPVWFFDFLSECIAMSLSGWLWKTYEVCHNADKGSIVGQLYSLCKYLIWFTSDQLIAMVLVIPQVNVLQKEELLLEIVPLGK